MRIFKDARGPNTGLRATGSHYLRVTRWGDVVQKWPRKRPVGMTPWEYYKRAEFAYAAYWASIPEPMSYATAKFISQGTDYLPRDMLVCAMYATLYDITDQDGNHYGRVRDVAQNPQLILDLVTSTPGAILYRSQYGWVGVDPGNSGQVLAIINAVPTWQDVYPVAVETAELLLKTADPSLHGARVVDDSASILASWSTPGHVSFKREALTGDVTAANNSNATTIAANAVTLTKLVDAAAQGNMLARIGSGSGDFEQCTLHQILDLYFGSTQGTIAYRGASSWEALAPGTALQFLQTMGAGGNPQWATPSGGTGTTTCDIQTFATPGNFSGAAGWQKPTGGKFTDVFVVGAGAGGGSGRRGLTSENRGGGAGGSGGGLSWARFLTSDLAAQVELNVGQGGTGGAGRTTDNTNGNAGQSGTQSTFGNAAASAIFVQAAGGQSGGAGTTSATLGSSGGTGRAQGGTAGTGNNVSAGGAAPSSTSAAPGGGGGGGGLTSSGSTTRDGGAGGAYSQSNGFFATGHTSTVAAGGVGSTKTAAQNGTAFGYDLGGGGGGGGGWCNNDGTAGAGGNGAAPGGGGGGGGGSTNGNTSGKGGDGANGRVVVVTWF